MWPFRSRVILLPLPDVTDRMARRLHGLGTTIFAEMSALAVRTGSVNLGQGFPDTDGPPAVLEAAVAAIRNGGNQYPPGNGVPMLRDAVTRHQERFYGLTFDWDTEVLVTTGATEAIAAAVLGLVEPGDEVVALEPFYDSYPATVAMAGGRLVPVTLRPPEFALDVAALHEAVRPQTRVLLLNSPHNPTGAVLSVDELSAVADVAVSHDLVVVTDEVYEHLTFDGVRHVPIATLPGMRERTLTIGSGGKTFSVTGWKIGWATGPAELVTAVRTAKQFLTYVSGAPFQPAIARGLALPDDYFTDAAAQLQARRDQLCAGLQSLGLDVFVPRGTYFATTDIRTWGYDDGLAFCWDLPRRASVAAIPHQVFYADQSRGRHLVRWAFCKRPEVIDEALNRLERSLRPARTYPM
jgi:N-succinyldiaminopimelate aminotransferase